MNSKFNAKDAVGNWTYGVHVVNVDSTAPNSYQHLKPTKSKSFVVQPIADAVEYEVYLNGESQGTQENTTFVSSSNLTNGTHELKMRLVIDLIAPNMKHHNSIQHQLLQMQFYMKFH